ncbi:FRG domain-containing protein [Bradyrhizobium tropiciagri]|uniref:FRG domain-containing protein n=1 Tax=Bradyrhizobium tropiciagri TaxID=312253 RepID=UPI001BA830D8|nr:FRG domain-containing protein [Bradyrhizobium tropiciagri]MBR0897119.1 FRG domain-containing protein [Bradyrhizobium tropiciagri]
MTSSISRAPKKRRVRRQGVIVRQIENWSDFLTIIQRWDGFRNWCFRGQGSASWSLQSSLSRHTRVSQICPKAWELQETRIRRIFERKSHLFLDDPPQDELEWLALMQHHGAPTRLLDFTWSPYVAAFFALERATDDAAIWALNLPLLWSIHARLSVHGIKVFDASPRDARLLEKYYLPNKHAFVWHGDPFRMPQRVVAQAGTFLVSSNLGMNVEDILAQYPGDGELLIKFILPAAKVRAEAMASLYAMNITQATLFPGLDGLARSMAYEFEYSWQVDLQTNKMLGVHKDPYLPSSLLDTPKRN